MMDFKEDIDPKYKPGKVGTEVEDQSAIKQGDSTLREKKFLNCLENARNILCSLQKSLQKTKKYEKLLMKCKSNHVQAQRSGCISEPTNVNSNVWKGAEPKKSAQSLSVKKSPSTIIEVADSWSSSNISCLQFQYYELSRRYETLLQAYDERCRAVAAKDSALALMRKRAKDSYTELSHAHHALLSVGERYLALKNVREHQTQHYEEKLEQLKHSLRQMLCEVERARSELDTQLGSSMTVEKHAATALLLAEIRKCNLLYLENVRLKEQMAELT